MKLNELTDLVKLSTGAQGLRRELTSKATIPDDANGDPIIDFRSSDSTLDRYNEIIVASGWQLDNYRRNPVVQNSHKYGNILDTIGKALITEVQGDSLYQRVKFAVNENPIAKICYNLYKGGFLHAVSVGFIPITWENGTAEAGYRRKYTKQELLEVSAVSIPANPNALALGLKSGAIEHQDVNEAYKLLKHLADHRINPEEIKTILIHEQDNQIRLVCPHCSDPISEKALENHGSHHTHVDCQGKVKFPDPNDAAIKRFFSNPEGTGSDSGAKGASADFAQLLTEAKAISQTLKA